MDNNTEAEKDNQPSSHTDGSNSDNQAAQSPPQQNLYEAIINDPKKLRFHVELEFIQCLSNPKYIHFLAQQGYFDKPEFIEYLDYLQYWKKPEYAKFVIYPNSLHFLELLQSGIFREAMKKEQEMLWLHEKQIFHWMHNKKSGANNKVTEAPNTNTNDNINTSNGE